MAAITTPIQMVLPITMTARVAALTLRHPVVVVVAMAVAVQVVAVKATAAAAAMAMEVAGRDGLTEGILRALPVINVCIGLEEYGY